MCASRLDCFQACDVRGRVPEDLDLELAQKIGRAFAAVCDLSKVVVGRDIRLTSEALSRALIEGLCDMGCDVYDIGLGGTEEMYHAVFSLSDQGVDGGVMVTASHNPAAYNGMKFVTADACPVTWTSGLQAMEEMIVKDIFPPLAGRRGICRVCDTRAAYIERILNSVETSTYTPLKIVVNSGNGCAGPVIDHFEAHLPFTFIKLLHEPDGRFPHGVPNPLLLDNRELTTQAVREHDADLGIAWDGDFDRCFFWDEHGDFIESYYIVGLLACEMLQKEAGAKILYDPRLIWNTEELILAHGGIPVMTTIGHTLIKERMRKENALYGGEMSAHHYFRDFGQSDSGMLPWLLLTSLLCRKGTTLSELIAERKKAYPVSGEINSTVKDADAVIAKIRKCYADGQISEIDGLSIEYPKYRFNIRKSSTEPFLLRLNVEARGDKELLRQQTEALLRIIRGQE